MIDIENLAVRRDGRVICRLDRLVVRPGGRLALLGANGTGKTTLLRVLAGLEARFTGHLAISAPPAQRVFVHQTPYLFRGTVLFNATYGARVRGHRTAEATPAALAMLDRMGIESLAARRAFGLSGGERRRVALARAMVLKPQLLLLDEPFAELDADAMELVRGEIERLGKESTVIISSPQEIELADDWNLVDLSRTAAVRD